LTVHGNFRKEGLRQKFSYPNAIKSADIVTVPSVFLKNELNLERARIIPNAVNIDEFNQVTLRRDLDNPKILTVMNFNFWHKAKGIVEIAKILSKLSREINRPVTYTIAGDGPERRKIEQTVKALENDFLKINFTGFDDPKKYFPKTDIFVYCSGFDNMPIAVIEAMAAGLPVISNKVGAISEIITSAVDGFISSDPADYQYNLNHMLEDSNLRQKLGQAARQKVKEKFDWSVILPQWINIYSDLLK
jgi:glycosyltransferase involved in cell wall biosynthesis